MAATRSRLLPMLLLGLALAVGWLAWQFSTSPVRPLDWPLFDYVAFWSAGRLNLEGKDPYDPALLEALQRQADPEQVDTLVMWPAPWALTLLMPFAGFEPGTSHLLWLAFEFGVLLLALFGAWRVQGGTTENFWIAGTVAFTFPPTYFVLVTGQLGVFLLLGLVGFLWFLRSDRPLLAGAALALTAIKPQLTFLFWIVLLLWAIEHRSWRVFVGGVLGVGLLLAWPLWQNPSLPLHYWHALTARTQTHSHLSPVLGTALRLMFGMDRFWLQFVPVLPGIVWAVWFYARHRRAWNWRDRIPALLFASFLTASYGAWPFDLVVLLLPLIQRAEQLQTAGRPTIALAVSWHVLIGLAMLTQILAQAEYFWFLWATPVLWVGYALTTTTRSDEHVPHPPEIVENSENSGR